MYLAVFGGREQEQKLNMYVCSVSSQQERNARRLDNVRLWSLVLSFPVAWPLPVGQTWRGGAFVVSCLCRGGRAVPREGGLGRALKWG